MYKRQAIVQALNLSFPTVLPSGSHLSAAGFLIAQITTEPAIVGIGECLCRGTLISMFLVMFILPDVYKRQNMIFHEIQNMYDIR